MDYKIYDWQLAPGKIDKLTFAISDIHGCMDHLAYFYEYLEKVNEPFELIYLGDMIDRGPKNLEVLDRVWNWKTSNSDITILPGNHEMMMIMALVDPDNSMQWWAGNGGLSLLKEIKNEFSSYEDAANELKNCLKTKISDIIELPCAAHRSSYIFVHGGVPKVWIDSKLEFIDPLLLPDFDWHEIVNSTASTTHPLWVRDDFLSNTIPWKENVCIVHGHTPIVGHRANIFGNGTRINIDTGAVFGGTLSMIELKDNLMRIHEVK